MTKAKVGASESTLNLMHQMLAEYFIERLKSSKPDPNAPVEYDEETGEELLPFFIPLNAAELGVMVKFLKDNNISAAPDVAEMIELAQEFKDDIEKARRTGNAQDITQVQTNDQRMFDMVMS